MAGIILLLSPQTGETESHGPGLWSLHPLRLVPSFPPQIITQPALLLQEQGARDEHLTPRLGPGDQKRVPGPHSWRIAPIPALFHSECRDSEPTAS